jgi:hypothetical protein
MSTSTISATIAILLFAFDVVFIVGTIPSFRIALAMEKEEWKPFRNALDKSEERKKFDEMWDLPKWYISACSNSVQYVRLHPILMSILLYNFKGLTQCMSEVERIEAKVNSKKKEWLIKKERRRRRRFD